MARIAMCMFLLYIVYFMETLRVLHFSLYVVHISYHPSSVDE